MSGGVICSGRCPRLQTCNREKDFGRRSDLTDPERELGLDADLDALDLVELRLDIRREVGCSSEAQSMAFAVGDRAYVRESAVSLRRRLRPREDG